MSRTEEVELTNMCMVCDGLGNVLMQQKQCADWSGWSFPGGHVEEGECVSASVVREIYEETGLTVQNPYLCGIKEFHKREDGKRYIVFLYRADRFTGTLRASDEGEVFWQPLDGLDPQKLVPSFDEILTVYQNESVSEVFYERRDGKLQTVFY